MEETSVVQLKWRRRAIAVAWIISGVGLAMVAAVIPFISPALRRYCLPYVPATPVQIERVLLHLKGRSGTVVDLGSGDGRVVIAAAKAGHYAVGYELNPWLILYSRWKALTSGVHRSTEFHRKNLWKINLGEYENIVFFGVEQMMHPLGEKLSKEATPTAQVIACRFRFPHWTPSVKFEAGPNSVFVYDKLS